MINRLLYSCIQILRFRSSIKTGLKKQWFCDEVIDITNVNLAIRGIKILVLDFDGVLSSHGKNKPNENVISWLKTINIPVYILSNKPTAIREKWFAENFADIKFISGVKKKPYPNGLLDIVSITKKQPDEIVLVDDRLLTGCLAAVTAGCQFTWISKPYADFTENGSKSEKFFKFLRTVDKKILSIK